MDIAEYASKVGTALRNAHNAKNMAEVNAIFAKADDTLAKHKVSQKVREAFWSSARKAMFSTGLLVEKQANSSLLDLMKAIEQGLKAREGK